MVLGSISSVQCGAALATTLFGRIGSEGAVFLRAAFGALILLAVAHRDVVRLRRADLREIALFGITLAAMNVCFYAAIERLPLGIAVTFEFVGPLAVAIFGSRRRTRPGLGGARGARHRPAVAGTSAAPRSTSSAPCWR